MIKGYHEYPSFFYTLTLYNYSIKVYLYDNMTYLIAKLYNFDIITILTHMENTHEKDTLEQLQKFCSRT